MLHLCDVYCPRGLGVGTALQEVRTAVSASYLVVVRIHEIDALPCSEIRGTWDPAVPKVNRRFSFSR